MAHTENSGEGGVSSNSQSNYTNRNSLTAGDTIESNKAMFSALTEVLQTTLTSMGNQLHEHSKCQMKQVNKLTEAVNQITPAHNANRLVAKSTDDPEILIIQTLGKMMKLIMDGIGSLSMKLIVAFTMKMTWQLPFCLIRRPHHLQWQQQVSRKVIP